MNNSHSCFIPSCPSNCRWNEKRASSRMMLKFLQRFRCPAFPTFEPQRLLQRLMILKFYIIECAHKPIKIVKCKVPFLSKFCLCSPGSWEYFFASRCLYLISFPREHWDHLCCREYLSPSPSPVNARGEVCVNISLEQWLMHPFTEWTNVNNSVFVVSRRRFGGQFVKSLLCQTTRSSGNFPLVRLEANL